MNKLLRFIVFSPLSAKHSRRFAGMRRFFQQRVYFGQNLLGSETFETNLGFI